MADFARVLRLLRNEKNMSQSELSDALGISKSSVNMYERGERQPNFETLELIADFFNVDIDYLLGRTDKTTRIPLPHTIAAHLNADDLTEAELHDVVDYIAFIKSKRK